MIDTTWERWADSEAGFDAAWEAACNDPIKMLGVALERSGRRVSFDLGRDYTKPCTCCATTTERRELVAIGRYPNGSRIERPACLRCRVVLHYCDGCEPDDRQLQYLAAYEVASMRARSAGLSVPTAEMLAMAVAELTSGRPRGLRVGWSEVRR